jgi:hypothetical protein
MNDAEHASLTIGTLLFPKLGLTCILRECLANIRKRR